MGEGISVTQYQDLTTKLSGNALADAAMSREIAETQASMLIAKRFPRNTNDAIGRIVDACTRPGLAETALYSYTKGGTEVSGPSIRLAEAIAQQWGNIDFGLRELDQSNGESTVEAFAFDKETNTRQTKTFRIPHMRHTRSGAYKLTDPREIYEMVANQGARRLRACILGVIPGDVVEAAQRQCEITLKASTTADPETISRMVSTFETEFGVKTDQIKKRYGKSVDALNPTDIVGLKKIYRSLKDGMSAVADWFETEPTAANALKEKIQSMKSGEVKE